MSSRNDMIYDSETGDILQDSSQEGNTPFEPLSVPLIVEQFMDEYIPAQDERTATDVMSLGDLRTRFCAWMPYGNVKQDPLQNYLNQLADNGYFIRQTSSGPAMLLLWRGSGRVVEVEPQETTE